MAYSKFDFSNVTFEDDLVPMDEALKDEPAFDIPTDVIQGKRTISVSDPVTDKDSRKVGVRISYV